MLKYKYGDKKVTKICQKYKNRRTNYMKRRFFLTLVVLFLFSGCGNNFGATENMQQVEMHEKEQEQQEQHAAQLPEGSLVLPNSREEILEVYRKEVSSRLEDGVFFNAEEHCYEKLSFDVCDDYIELYNIFTVTKYRYPILFFDREDLKSFHLVYIDDSYTVWIEKFVGEKKLFGGYRGSGELNIIGGLHYYKSIIFCYNYSLNYNHKENTIQKYAFGELIENFYIPQGYSYCGYNTDEGHFFQKGSEIYILSDIFTDAELTLFANNVKEILTLGYQFSSSQYNQPLFLMEDGTIMVYAYASGPDGIYKDDFWQLEVEY